MLRRLPAPSRTRPPPACRAPRPTVADTPPHRKKPSHPAKKHPHRLCQQDKPCLLTDVRRPSPMSPAHAPWRDAAAPAAAAAALDPTHAARLLYYTAADRWPPPAFAAAPSASCTRLAPFWLTHTRTATWPTAARPRPAWQGRKHSLCTAGCKRAKCPGWERCLMHACMQQTRGLELPAASRDGRHSREGTREEEGSQEAAEPCHVIAGRRRARRA